MLLSESTPRLHLHFYRALHTYLRAFLQCDFGISVDTSFGHDGVLFFSIDFNLSTSKMHVHVFRHISDKFCSMTTRHLLLASFTL